MRPGVLVGAMISLLMVAGPGRTAAELAHLPQLRVSENGRFLVKEDGSPFFWLGDTAWELFHRLNLEESEQYLRDRAGKGFTVIQAVVLAEADGLNVPNANGDLPLQGNDPTRPNERYFAHVDAVVAAAARLGLYVGMLPTWGDKWNKKWGDGPEIFTPENAAAFGEFLGRRYRDQPIVWVLGGDRSPENERHLAIVRALAAGLRRGDGGRHLLTYHPSGGQGSAQWFHGDEWLSFNMIQSGHHTRNNPNYEKIAADYARTPAKPCMDGEPCYEGIAVAYNPALGRFADLDVRQAAYWAVLAGAHGHTYGANGVFQFHDGARRDKFGATVAWQQALTFPGSGQLRHLRALMESRPFLSRIPDQALVVPAPARPARLTHLAYTRAADGHAALYVDGRQEASGEIGGRLANWDAGLRLALGNELTGDRPWRGEYYLVALYDRALTAEEVGRRFRAGPRSVPAEALVRYTFTAGKGEVVADEGWAGIDLRISDPTAVAWLPGGGLTVCGPVLIASEGPATAVTEAIARSQAITIEAWVKPADCQQGGPARIVTLSHDTSRRGFTLGQDGRAYEVRLRTSATSENGLPGLSAGQREEPHVQASRDADGSYAMVYVPSARQAVVVNTERLSGKRLKAWWYDPRTGKATPLKGDFPVGGRLRFRAPDPGSDWVLVLDDASRGYPPPGSPASH